MKILVTGATGFIGGELIKYLINQNQYSEIRVIARDKTKLKENISSNDKIKVFENDILDLDGNKNIFSNIDQVFHFAAIASDRLNYEEMARANVEGTRIISQNILRYSPKVKLFLQMSSTGVYGMNLPENKPIKENHKKKPSSYYQKSKWEAERILWKMNKEENLPVIMLRPPTMIGPGDTKTMHEVVNALRNKKFPLINSGKNTLTIMDVRDLIGAIKIIIENYENNIGEAFNLFSFRVLLKDYLSFIMNEIGEDYELKNYPYKLAYAVGLFAEIKDKIFRTQSTRNRYRIRKFGKTRLFDDTKIQKIGFKPKFTYKESVKDTLDWLRNCNYI